MALAILTLIEINERIKAKKKQDTGSQVPRDPEDCKENEDCAGCGLVEVCEKEKKTGH